MSVIGKVIFILGLGTFCTGMVMFYIAAFRRSLLWGVGCLLFAPASLFFLFIGWQEAKRPWFIWLGGGALMLVGLYLQGFTVNELISALMKG